MTLSLKITWIFVTAGWAFFAARYWFGDERLMFVALALFVVACGFSTVSLVRSHRQLRKLREALHG